MYMLGVEVETPRDEPRRVDGPGGECAFKEHERDAKRLIDTPRNEVKLA